MKNFLLERLSSEPDKSAVSRNGDGSPEYLDDYRDVSDDPSQMSSNPVETFQRHSSYQQHTHQHASDSYLPASVSYAGGVHSSLGNIICGKDQQTNRILELYDEYKAVFKSRLLGKVEKIVVEMMEHNRESPLIHLIHGEMFLYRGNAEKSHHHLTKYIENIKAPDDYALLVIATWNDFMNYKDLAFKQYAACLDTLFDTTIISRALFNLTCIKKKQRFLDPSALYFNRLLATPEGFQLLPCIQVEMIHIHILKKNRATAIEEIRKMSRHVPCPFAKRLRAYLDYTEKNYEAVLKYRDCPSIDPYIFYLIGRIGSELAIPDIDITHCFDESLRNSCGSPVIYNSYGNYYFKMGRYSDAATQYKNALALSPFFQPALDNMKQLNKASELIYMANNPSEMPVLVEADPDVEEMGFLFVWSLLGYSQFKGDFPFLRPLVIALPYVQ